MQKTTDLSRLLVQLKIRILSSHSVSCGAGSLEDVLHLSVLCIFWDEIPLQPYKLFPTIIPVIGEDAIPSKNISTFPRITVRNV